MLAHPPQIERAAVPHVTKRAPRGRPRAAAALLGAFVAAIASAAGAPVSLREVRQSLFGACFPTDRDGWMVGELGRIFHTSDGGTTWERQDAGTKRPFLAIACLDARRSHLPPAARAGREHALRHPLHRRAARVGGRHRRRHPAHRGRRRHLADADAARPPAELLRRLRARAERLDRRQRGHGAEEHRRRRHVDGRADADRARRQLDPVGVAGTRRPGLRGRRRRSRLPDRRRHPPASRRQGADEGAMIPKRWIEAYLRFLLRNRLAVSVVVALMTVFFAGELRYIKVVPQFLDFYPGPSHVRLFGHEYTWRKGHPYINIYNTFRRMFGSANILTVILETKHGDVYNPTTLQKLDTITKRIVETKGVVPYQVLSIAHPKMKSITTYAGAIQIREVFYPGVPQTQDDANRVKFAVYSTKGIRGLYVSQDDTAVLVHAGFWEEELDFRYLYDRMMELQHDVEDENHTVYITGFPWLYTTIQRYVPQVSQVFVLTVAALAFLLWNYFRTWTGIWVPMFSGLLSGIWALAFGPLLGLNLDPLVLVIPIFLTARALSHSVQSMDRYHEEYHRLADKHAAIVESYSHLFPPAIASILAVVFAILVVAIAPVPLIQKDAVFSSFWVISIFVRVVTLHPIILSVINPPGLHVARYPRWLRWLGHGLLIAGGALFALFALRIALELLGPVKTAVTLVLCVGLYAFHEQIYKGVTDAVIAASAGRRRWAVAGLSIAP